MMIKLKIDKNGDKAVTSIARHPFDWDTSIETVYIGKDVAELRGETFRNLRALKKFEVSKENKNFCAVDGILYTKDMKTLLCYPTAYEGEESFRVPEGVEVIGRSAFSDCKLKEIYLPEGLKTIETLAFLKAVNLKEIYSYDGDKVYKSLPEGLEFIGVDAFNYASSLTYLYIPSTIKTIDSYSFTYCAKINDEGEKAGITEVNVALSEEEFKKITAGDHWIPEFRNADGDIAKVNYSAERISVEK